MSIFLVKIGAGTKSSMRASQHGASDSLGIKPSASYLTAIHDSL